MARNYREANSEEEEEEGKEEVANNQNTIIILKVQGNSGIQTNNEIKSREGTRRNLFLEALSV